MSNRQVLMKPPLTPFIPFAATALAIASATFGGIRPAQAENIEHVQRLMSDRECQTCELSGSSFVHTDLSGVSLVNADLSRANLNRADLRNADLRGANLTGAILFNANLAGADLRGADLRGADLRQSYLLDADFEGANVEGANLRGAIGVPQTLVSPADYYRWGAIETQRGNFEGAVGYYTRSLSLDATFAPSFLGRSIARYELGDETGAIEDATRAEELFTAQNNVEGQQAAVRIQEGIAAVQEARAEADGESSGGSRFLNFLGGVGMLLLRFVL